MLFVIFVHSFSSYWCSSISETTRGCPNMAADKFCSTSVYWFSWIKVVVFNNNLYFPSDFINGEGWNIFGILVAPLAMENNSQSLSSSAPYYGNGVSHQQPPIHYNASHSYHQVINALCQSCGDNIHGYFKFAYLMYLQMLSGPYGSGNQQLMSSHDDSHSYQASLGFTNIIETAYSSSHIIFCHRLVCPLQIVINKAICQPP